MSYLRATLRALRSTIKNFARKPQTVDFPKVVRPRAERYRASFALLHDETGDEACIGCLQCERICPSQVIAIKAAGKRESPITGKKRGYADDFVLDLSACIFCELCVQVCPTDAIVMTRVQEVPGFGREDLVLSMAKLYANEKEKPRAWGDGTKLMGMQESAKKAKAATGAAVTGSPVTGTPAAGTPAGTGSPATGSPAATSPATGAPAAASPATGSPDVPLARTGTGGES